MQIITVQNLQKDFGNLHAVRGIDFSVEQGTMFAFLGPNGAGKSTTIDILCTLLAKDSGHIIIDGDELGKNNDAIRNKIGVVFQGGVLDDLLTVRENLELRATFYGLRGNKINTAVENAAKVASVTDFIDRQYGKLSGGQRRRADIARALINTPKILFLDEPTTGLDPQTKQEVWQTITQLQKNTGMTVFLTTHYMEEAATADYITLIDHGRIAAQGTPYELKDKYSSDTLRIKPSNMQEIQSILAAHKLDFAVKSDIIIAKIASTISTIPILQEARDYMESFEVIHGSMEDVFLNIIGSEGEYNV